MAHFRAVIQGTRGQASRLGGKGSGISANVASWQGGVDVRLWYDEANDVDMCRIELVPHYGKGTTRLLYDGPVSGASDFPITLIGDPEHAAKQQEAVARLTKSPTLGPCSCRRGIERDNCPICEGTGQRIDFAAIRARNTTR